MKLDNINMDYKEYIEKRIFKMYEKNEQGHGIEHIKLVIKRSLEFRKQFEDIDIRLLYIAVAFHDIGHHINKDKHEIISAKTFLDDNYFKTTLTFEERKIVAEAIEDHRASAKSEPRSIYGKILSSADRSYSLEDFIKRAYIYTITHNPDFCKSKILKEVYNHTIDKYGSDGYASTYVKDKEFENFKKTIINYENNFNEFSKFFYKVTSIYLDV